VFLADHRQHPGYQAMLNECAQRIQDAIRQHPGYQAMLDECAQRIQDAIEDFLTEQEGKPT
jgi:hypothetical protein